MFRTDRSQATARIACGSAYKASVEHMKPSADARDTIARTSGTCGALLASASPLTNGRGPPAPAAGRPRLGAPCAGAAAQSRARKPLPEVVSPPDEAPLHALRAVPVVPVAVAHAGYVPVSRARPSSRYPGPASCPPRRPEQERSRPCQAAVGRCG